MTKQSTKAKTAATKHPRGASKAAPAINIRADLSRYKIGEDKTPSGRKTVDIGDKTAELLRGKSLDQIYKLAAKKLGEDEQQLRERYKHLNPGMQRMSIGNRLRAASKEASAK